MFSLFSHTFKLFTWDLFLSLGSWPIWWYSRGLKRFHKFFIKRVKLSWRNRALHILLRSWFKPMYAQYDWQGRIISFFFRTLLIIWRFLMFVVLLLFYLLLYLAWIILPPLSVFVLLKIIMSNPF